MLSCVLIPMRVDNWRSCRPVSAVRIGLRVGAWDLQKNNATDESCSGPRDRSACACSSARRHASGRRISASHTSALSSRWTCVRRARMPSIDASTPSASGVADGPMPCPAVHARCASVAHIGRSIRAACDSDSAVLPREWPCAWRWGLDWRGTGSPSWTAEPNEAVCESTGSKGFLLAPAEVSATLGRLA